MQIHLQTDTTTDPRLQTLQYKQNNNGNVDSYEQALLKVVQKHANNANLMLTVECGCEQQGLRHRAMAVAHIDQ